MYFEEQMRVECESNVGMKQFSEHLDEKRKQIFSSIFPADFKEKYDEFTDIKELESGEYAVKFKGVNFKFLMQKKKSDNLYVFLNGAAGLDGRQKGNYQRWSWGNLVDASILNILDPMYYEYENLPIGWYWGKCDVDYRQLMAELIVTIANMLEVPYSHITLYGSSAGGTASIYTAHYIPGCTAVALNPQIRPWKHEWHENFKNIVGLDTEKDDKFHRNDIEWHIKNSPNCKFVIVVNCRSRRDYNWQIVPLAQKLDFKIEYGLSQHENLFTWIFDTGSVSKHSALDYTTIFIAIDNVIGKIKKNIAIGQVKNDVCLINEFWREHWESLQAIEDVKK